MQEQIPPSSVFHNQFSDSAARLGRVPNNPSVNRRFHGPESLTIPAHNHFDPQGVRVKARDIAKYSRYRNQAVWAQALVLFNVVGVPLSQGIYLEYYYTTALPDRSLTALSIIPALQILCILATPNPLGWFYYSRGPRSGWRIIFLLASFVGIGAQLALQWTKSYTPTMLLQGPLLGCALGTLFTISTLVLSSHYKFDVPLVSTQSGFMGFFGAIIYSVIAELGLRSTVSFASAGTAGLMATTLIAANLLIHRVDPPQRSATSLPSNSIPIANGKATWLFIPGYILIFSAMFTFPIYCSLTLQDPNSGFYTLVAVLSTAALTACISPRTRLGPFDTFVAAAVFCGAVGILPVWMSSIYIAVPAGAAYGVGLGAIIPLHLRVIAVFLGHWSVRYVKDTPAKIPVMMALGGVSACAGIVVSAVLMENFVNGKRITGGIAAVCLVTGGILVGFARWLICRRLGVAI